MTRRPRRRALARAVGAGAMLVLMLGGCGSEPDAEESKAALDDSRARVESRVGEAASALRDAGFELSGATGEWSSCRMEPSSGMEYYAGGSVTGGEGDPVARVAAVADALEALGWEPEASGETPRPYANFADGDLFLSVKESKVEPGTISLSVTGPCLDSTTDQENERLGQEFDLS